MIRKVLDTVLEKDVKTPESSGARSSHAHSLPKREKHQRSDPPLFTLTNNLAKPIRVRVVGHWAVRRAGAGEEIVFFGLANCHYGLGVEKRGLVTSI